MSLAKYRIWDGVEMQDIDLYWFEENGIRDWPEDGKHLNTVLMQYIDVEDLDGKHIAEGDIVQHVARPEFSGIVRFAKGGFFVVAKTKTDDRQEVWQGLFMEKHCVVRGNGYQNPELMDWFVKPQQKKLPSNQGRVRVNRKVVEGEVVTDKDVGSPKKRGKKYGRS